MAAQFDGPFTRLDRLRRRRNLAEYPDIDTPAVTRDDALAATETAEAIRQAATDLLHAGQLSLFER